MKHAAAVVLFSVVCECQVGVWKEMVAPWAEGKWRADGGRKVSRDIG